MKGTIYEEQELSEKLLECYELPLHKKETSHSEERQV